MRIKRRFGAVFAIVATAALVASGCSSGDSDDSGSKSDLYAGPVTLEWWHNGNQEGPLRTTTARRALRVPGGPPSANQTGVRWKFWAERDGVGPRWPW